MAENLRTPLQRLLDPRTVAVIGGRPAEVAVEQCRAIGYTGEIWPVHPGRERLGGIACFPDLAALPGVPDAAFVAVNRERTVEVVGELARLGVGGVVCHASGYAEDGEEGARLERDLVTAAGGLALIGPNCLGLVNYLDGVALWPEQHGGVRVERGVALIAQSGNIAENLTMHRRSLPIAALVTIGNGAVTGVVDLVEAMLDDPRVTAIGLCLEEIPEVAAFSRVAIEALRRRVPVVALKSGSSELGAQVTLSHTSSLADSDVLVDALLARLGIARVHDVETFLETLKLLHVHGARPGTTIASASCSGGEAALLADLAHQTGLTMPALPDAVRARLHHVLGDRVSVRNPLDYHTYIWGDADRLTECFTALLGAGLDQHLLMLDFPRSDRCDVGEFETTVAAWQAAHRATGARTCVVSSLPESMPEDLGRRLLDAGIAPMQGISSALTAIALAARVGEAQETVDTIVPLPTVGPLEVGPDGDTAWDEARAKAALTSYGLSVPASAVTDDLEELPALATGLGYPVVLKALSPGLAHKSDVGGVVVGLDSEDAVRRAAVGLARVADRFLVERMVPGALIELLVGVQRDPRLGLGLTVGAGGVLVELVDDTATLLLPATRPQIRAALTCLRIGPLLTGHRGRVADLAAAVEAIEAIAAFAIDHADRLVEVEVNPLLVLAEGAVAVDALIRLAGPVG
ncbi:acetate--CoA ligase family protein [Nocardioides cynanchi]|uniref:acetate--CoA ligase family protein n=1 Tax=Nocardioides cynanchi TaxID=2558918 RepID=UPI00124622DE|nr:acetate--CoA ligase family protein [Nocardioides cynanchi]